MHEFSYTEVFHLYLIYFTITYVPIRSQGMIKQAQKSSVSKRLENKCPNTAQSMEKCKSSIKSNSGGEVIQIMQNRMTHQGESWINRFTEGCNWLTRLFSNLEMLVEWGRSDIYCRCNKPLWFLFKKPGLCVCINMSLPNMHGGEKYYSVEDPCGSDVFRIFKPSAPGLLDLFSVF